MSRPALSPVQTFDLRRPNLTWEESREFGKSLRAKVPREAHGEFRLPKHRPDPIDTIIATNKGRQERLIPLRMSRMAASEFAFLRGAAAVMATDLGRTPVTGIRVQMDGDAHLNNFGLYGTIGANIVFDLNDFDESTGGYWEWDLKRLAASVNVAARANGFSRRQRRDAVVNCVMAYRTNLQRLECMGVLQIWSLHAHPGQENPLLQVDAESKLVIKEAIREAGLNTNNSLLARIAIKGTRGAWRLQENPPTLTRIDRKTRESVIDGINTYADSLHREMRYLLGRYHVVDVVHRAVGVGSVGTRAYLALLFGNGDHDPLFLQVKEAWPSASAPYVPPVAPDLVHEGKRVVVGQRALQARSDIMLGWTTIEGRPFYVRQMRNMKGSFPVESLDQAPFHFYVRACGSVLARAHARTGDAGAISGYCGKAPVLDRAIADWAEAYGNQNAQDHEALVKAIGSKRVPALKSN